MIRAVHGADPSALFRLRERLWSPGNYHRSRGYWEWQALRNPHLPSGGGPQAWLAFGGAEALAEAQGLPVLVQYRGRTLDASWCIELYTLPPEQRRGLGTSLVARWREAAGLALVMGASRDSHPVFLKQGLKPLGTMSLWVAPATATGRLKDRLRGRPVLGSGGHPVERRPCPRFEPAWDPVWNRARGESAHVRRDHAWLSWRFADQPGVTYERLLFLREGAPCGYAVLRPGNPCRIVDFAALNGSLSTILGGCRLRAQELGARMLELPLFAPSLEARLPELGFRNAGPWRALLAQDEALGWDWWIGSADSDQEHPEDSA